MKRRSRRVASHPPFRPLVAFAPLPHVFFWRIRNLPHVSSQQHRGKGVLLEQKEKVSLVFPNIFQKPAERPHKQLKPHKMKPTRTNITRPEVMNQTSNDHPRDTSQLPAFKFQDFPSLPSSGPPGNPSSGYLGG